MILDSKIIIFTDGSSRGNPGPGGWGAILIFPEGKNEDRLKVPSEKLRIVELGGGEKLTTNNRMEMMAVINALKFVSSTDYLLPTTICIYCDSGYVINGATKWAKGWEANGWKTKAKEDVLNKDLWEEMIFLTEKFNIEWIQIEGHMGIAGNERCDVIATSNALGEKIDLYNGPFSGYGIDILSLSTNGNGKKSSKSSAKAYSYVSKVDGKILTHKTWRECEVCVKGKSGVRFKKSLSKSDEEKIIEEFSL